MSVVNEIIQESCHVSCISGAQAAVVLILVFLITSDQRVGNYRRHHKDVTAGLNNLIPIFKFIAVVILKLYVWALYILLKLSAKLLKLMFVMLKLMFVKLRRMFSRLSV